MDPKSSRRLAMLASHLNLEEVKRDAENFLTAQPVAGSGGHSRVIDVGAMRAFLDGAEAKIRNQVRDLIAKNPEFNFSGAEVSKEEHREIVLKELLQLTRARIIHVDMVEGKPAEYSAVVEQLLWYSGSLMTKVAVHFGLWGASISALGTARHRHLVEPSNGNLDIRGCFLMTEIGHGSNVRGLETTATYDVGRQVFVIQTPHAKARKFWIGNAAAHANYGVVFARLIVKGHDHGIHLLVVPIRDSRGNVLPGITIADCGKKEGLNGVDNGAVHFNGVVVPRTNLLNAIADVDPDGTYKGPSEGVNFGRTLGALSGGRLHLTAASIGALKIATTIATRHGWARRQFGRPGSKTEVPLMTYATHQRRIVPLIAYTYSADAFFKFLAVAFKAGDQGERGLIHSLTAGSKATATWTMVRGLQTLRECLGGQGLRWSNRLGELKCDTDVFVTFEGDNTVLMQTTARYLLGLAKKAAKTGKWTSSLSHLNTRSNANANGPSGVRCPDFILSVLRAREGAKLKELGNTLAAASKNMDAWSAWNSVGRLVQALSWAHMDRLIFEHARTAAGNAVGANRQVLLDLAVLNALRNLEDDLGWTVANGLLKDSIARKVSTEMDVLCAELTPATLSLVEAFGVPEKCLPDPEAIVFE